ncbi:MAG TPA: transcriptional repressor [candidate division Zixibacteria bacterium]|nr:transcriptional repressor [candidate division Zixibacteria bacterium]MDD4917870.1 transcriptional repressor [candidate division Zixibacteria bacterium]MDM7973518.1 transcriptional repressor [candidate division Zixibacteria bacterium]HOD67462.1 transcriptional repressor [candidate division Zixibacteria bacterium]HOZ08288.1 transcriptional repressor [candidate division Zixibacteria bacterium]
MREFLRTKGFKMTPQRELVFRAFFELGDHVTVDELFEKVRRQDRSIGYSTVWRNLKLICRVGLAEEVNVGDGVTRYDRVTHVPHGHLYCQECRRLTEFPVEEIVAVLAGVAEQNDFRADSFKIEIHGYCEECRERRRRALGSGGGAAPPK